MRDDQREQLELIVEQALSTAVQEPEERPREQYAWTCSQCAEEIPSSFDVCWNCGTDRNGAIAPFILEALAKSDPIESSAESPAETADADVRRRCMRCGSAKVAANVQVVDQGQGSSGSLRLVVYGAPEALLFKDRRWGEIAADFCGECGHVELRVRNCKEVYNHYLQSKGEANV